jgi:hypothetical protein
MKNNLVNYKKREISKTISIANLIPTILHSSNNPLNITIILAISSITLVPITIITINST